LPVPRWVPSPDRSGGQHRQSAEGCALKNGSISLVVPEANSLGLAMLGGGSLDSALQAVIDGEADAIVVLENDLYRMRCGKGGRRAWPRSAT
jgi:hypothetical protein